MNTDTWIVVDPNGGYEELPSEAEAVGWAESLIQEFLWDEWDESVEQILVAKITHRVGMTNRRSLEEADEDEKALMIQNNWGFMCDYEVYAVGDAGD